MRRALAAGIVALALAPVAAASPVLAWQPDAKPLLPSAAAQRHAVARLTRLGRPVFCAGPAGDAVALTFDDGPGPFTQRVLDELREHDAHATFFLVGNRIGYWPEAAAAERLVGAVGDHTWSHPPLTTLPRWAVWLELARTRESVRRALGGEPTLFRAPYELHDETVDGVVRRSGMLDVLWSVDSGDSDPHATARRVVRRVLRGLRPGAIVLMHDIHPWTVAALPRILAALDRRGLRAVSVPELLALDPPADAAACPIPRAGD
ncbi:MAG TPA: polysaccharide deacetylase family protein [Gaiellaceae bacterium]